MKKQILNPLPDYYPDVKSSNPIRFFFPHKMATVHTTPLIWQSHLFDPTSYPGAYFNLALRAAQENLPGTAIFRMKQYLMLVPDAKDARSAQDRIFEWEIMM